MPRNRSVTVAFDSNYPGGTPMADNSIPPRHPTSLTRSSDPFLSLNREMNRLFDDMVRGFGLRGPGEGMTGTPMLTMDVSETDQCYKIRADVPGASENDIDVAVHENVLTIQYERRQERTEERESYHLMERQHGSVRRSLRLPSDIEPDQIKARFENGVLELTLPKSADAKRSRKIAIESAGTGATAGMGGQDRRSAGGGTVGVGPQASGDTPPAGMGGSQPH